MKTNRNSFIGVFDSGVGGLTLLPALQFILPHEQFLYVSDDAHAPYGGKSKEEIIERCNIIVQFLIDKGCKIIIVACNTATTNAIETLRATYSIPFIGIEPAIKPAALKSKTKVVGVLATQGTLSSALFAKTSAAFTQDVLVVEQIGSGLVEAIETGSLDDPKLTKLVRSYINPMLEQEMDTLVLGCTHYPLLLPLIKKVLPSNIQIIDSAEAVAKQTHRILEENQLICQTKEIGHIQYFSSAKNSTLIRFIPKGTKVLSLTSNLFKTSWSTLNNF